MATNPNDESASRAAARRVFSTLKLRPVSLVSWRDAVVTLAPFVVLALIAVVLMLHFLKPAPPKHLRLAAGADGSSFQTVAQRYKAILARNGITLDLVPTEGSAENLGLLAQHKVDIALVQAGVTLKDEAGKDGIDDVVSLGTVQRQPLLIFYRAAKPIAKLSELQGRKLAIGAQGSGTRVLALALLAANGIAENDRKTDLSELDGDEAVSALESGKIDAMFLSGDNASLLAARQLLHADGVRLYDFGAQGDAYERRFRYLNRFDLPEGAFDLGENLPGSKITMMAPTVELLAHEDLNPGVTDLLVEAAQEVHSRASLMQNPGEFPHPLEQDYPMSDEATRYYASGKTFVYRYLPFWLASLISRVAVIVPVLVVVFSGLQFAPKLYGWRVNRRIYKYYAELMSLERAVLEPNLSPAQIAELHVRLDNIEKAVVGTSIPGAYADQAFVLRDHIHLVRDSLEAGYTTPGERLSVAHS